MIESVVVDETIFELRPDFAALILCAYGVRNGPTDEASKRLLKEAEAEAVPRDHPHLEAWRAAYRAFGAKPKKTRPSVEALVRRTPLPEINQIVDAYNAVSVRHGLPVGGEDLDTYAGAPRLVRADGGEPFGDDPPEPGEVVWRDDLGVTCRRWNWRQIPRTRITEETTNAFFVLERLEPLTLEELRSAGTELGDHLRGISPGVEIHERLIFQGGD